MKRLEIATTVLIGLCASAIAVAQPTFVSVSKWIPTTGMDNWEEAANWNPQGIPGATSQALIEQVGDRTLTPIRLNSQQTVLGLEVLDAHAILNLNGNSLSVASGSDSPKLASLLVGGARGPGGAAVLEVLNGTLSGHFAYVGKGRPGELGPPPNEMPSLSVQGTSTLLLSRTLNIGYFDAEVSKERPGMVYIAGRATSDMVLITAGSKLAVIDGGALSVTDWLRNQPGGQLWIGKPPGTAYPPSQVSARYVDLSSSTTVDYGIVRAGQSITVGRGDTLISRGSQVSSPSVSIRGFASAIPHVTLADQGTLMTAANTVDVGGDGAAPGAWTAGTLTIGQNSRVTSGTRLTIWPPGLVENQGVITSPLVDVQGTLCGSGTINGNVVNAGTISPGCSIGSLRIVGNYEQRNRGKLVLEVGGSGAGEFDEFRIEGNASLGGTLEIRVREGFTPDPSKVLPIITATGLDGAFDNVRVSGAVKAETNVAGNTLQLKLIPQSPSGGVSPAVVFGLAIGLLLLILL